MNNPQDPARQHAGWGAPQPAEPAAIEAPRRRWSARRIAVAALVAVGIAGAGTGVVYAAGGSAGTDTQGPGGAQTGGPPGGGTGGPGQLSNALHGEYVVSDGDGAYTTELMQNGAVTAISDTSITAKSDDGYTKTYTIDADTVVGNGSSDLADIGTGDDVMIVASVSGNTATVDSLSEAGTGGSMAPPDQGSGS